MNYTTKHINEVISFFSEHKDSSFTVDKISEEIKDIPQSTTYRILNRLVEEGRIEKVSTATRRVEYRYTDPERCPHHLHLHCQKCGRVMHLEEDKSREILSILESASSFHAIPSSMVEGICNECMESEE